MKILTFIGLILCFNSLLSQTIPESHYSSQDTLYVGAKSGLNLRSEPTLSSIIIKKIDLNERVIIESISLKDTIANRSGNWVRIDHNETTGYLFDAYLNKFEIEFGESLFGNYIKNYLIKKYNMENPKVINRPCNGGKSCKAVELYSSESCILITEFGYEWWDMEIILKKWNINEVLNILENANCYMDVCDYPIAIKKMKGNEMIWETQTDDIFVTKILQGENNNLQINISWSY